MATISAGEQLMQAMVAALNAPDPKPCKCYRTRIDALTAAELPAFVLYAVEEVAQTRGPNTKLRTRTVRLECMVEGEPPADSLIDPLYVYAIQALQGDAAFEGLLRKLDEARIQWQTEASYQDASVALIDFELVFVTSLTDPTVRVL